MLGRLVGRQRLLAAGALELTRRLVAGLDRDMADRINDAVVALLIGVHGLADAEFAKQRGELEAAAGKILGGRFPERVLEKAVERMLPRGPLGRVQLGNLRVYAGPDHPHAAQNPEALEIASLNRKNARRA